MAPFSIAIGPERLLVRSFDSVIKNSAYENCLPNPIVASNLRYELEKKAKEAKKKQHTVDIKEIKIRYKIDTHDYLVRIKSIKKFISQGNKVKVVVMLRGREMQHSSLAFDLANRFIEDLKEEPILLEKKPMLEGRNVTMYFAPQA